MSAVRVRRSSRSWPPGASCLPSPRCSRGEAQHLPPASSWRWRGAGAGAGAPGVPGSGDWETWGGGSVLGSLYIWTLVYLEDRGLEEDCLVYTEEEEGAHCTPGLTLTL